jgi:hypothetical protein
MRFSLVMSNELAEEVARELSSDPSVTAEMTPGGEREKTQLQLSLGDVATIIAVIVGGIKIAEASVTVAKAIKTWLSSRNQESAKVIIRGPREDSLLTVNESMTAEQVAHTIQNTVAT